MVSGLVGRTFRLERPHRVDAERIADFAAATGAGSACHVDPAAAQARGYAGVLAPPTFPAVIAQPLFDRLFAAPELAGTAAVHVEQRVRCHRPLVAGDLVDAVLVVDSLRGSAAHTLLATHTELTAGGEPVASMWSVVVPRPR